MDVWDAMFRGRAFRFNARSLFSSSAMAEARLRRIDLDGIRRPVWRWRLMERARVRFRLELPVRTWDRFQLLGGLYSASASDLFEAMFDHWLLTKVLPEERRHLARSGALDRTFLGYALRSRLSGAVSSDDLLSSEILSDLPSDLLSCLESVSALSAPLVSSTDLSSGSVDLE